MTTATPATTTEGERRPAHRGARRRVALLAVAALAFAASCAKADEVSTSTTVGPAATSAPGTTEPATEEPGTTVKKSGTTSTTKKKNGGTSSTTDKRPGTTKKPSSTSTTLDVDTPPDAVEFCAKAEEIKELFSEQPDAADMDAYVAAVAVPFNELTALAPDAIADDMQTINDVFQSVSTYQEMSEAFSDGALDDVTDRIDKFTLANCGFEL